MAATSSVGSHTLADTWTVVLLHCRMGASIQRDLGPHGALIREQQILLKREKKEDGGKKDKCFVLFD